MSTNREDISDDEIRIISSDKLDDSPAVTDEHDRSNGSSQRLIVVAVVTIAVAVAILLCFLVFSDSDANRKSVEQHSDAVEKVDTVIGSAGYVEIADTTVCNIPLSIFTPRDATPILSVGPQTLGDPDAVFIVQAADIREDNGEIVGAFVTEGQLVSKGQSKAGFCAIIGGTPIIGVADSTPYLEQALDTEGYFFRQYPLVVGNQVVENKPKGKAVRRALAEINGRIIVIMSRQRETFHDFAKAIADLGASNAIYLVGASAYGFARDGAGNRIEFGSFDSDAPENTNYIVWR